jgi:pimeloyl-ACP methyl ester carboxylesterase
LNAYNQSLQFFQKWLDLQGEMAPCTRVFMPYAADPLSKPEVRTTLPGYWCPSALTGKSARGTILSVNGFDGNAEMLVHEVGLPSIRHGYNVLIVDGPGQGSAARYQRLTFRYDWEVVVQQMIPFARSLPGGEGPRMILWGESFGGYLAPRAFSRIPEISACVANGGIWDFFQVFYCGLNNSQLQFLYDSGNPVFDNIMGQVSEENLALNFAAQYAKLGFNTTTFSSLLNSLEPYWQTSIDGVRSRPVFVFDPSLDTSTGNQSQIFFSALPRPLSPSSQILRLDGSLGGALHCGVGSTSVVSEAILSWLDGLFSLQTAPQSSDDDDNSDLVSPAYKTGTIVLAILLGLQNVLLFFVAVRKQPPMPHVHASSSHTSDAAREQVKELEMHLLE